MAAPDSTLILEERRERTILCNCHYCGQKINPGDAFKLYRVRCQGELKNRNACFRCSNMLDACNAAGENIADITELPEFTFCYADDQDKIRDFLSALGWGFEHDAAQPPHFNNL